MDFNLEAIAGEDDGLLVVAPQPPLHHIRLQLERWSYITVWSTPCIKDFRRIRGRLGTLDSPSRDNCRISYVSYFQLHWFCSGNLTNFKSSCCYAWTIVTHGYEKSSWRSRQGGFLFQNDLPPVRNNGSGWLHPQEERHQWRRRSPQGTNTAQLSTWKSQALWNITINLFCWKCNYKSVFTCPAAFSTVGQGQPSVSWDKTSWKLITIQGSNLRESRFSRILEIFLEISLLDLDLEVSQFHFHFSKREKQKIISLFISQKEWKDFFFHFSFLEKSECISNFTLFLQKKKSEITHLTLRCNI